MARPVRLRQPFDAVDRSSSGGGARRQGSNCVAGWPGAQLHYRQCFPHSPLRQEAATILPLSVGKRNSRSVRHDGGLISRGSGSGYGGTHRTVSYDTRGHSGLRFRLSPYGRNRTVHIQSSRRSSSRSLRSGGHGCDGKYAAPVARLKPSAVAGSVRLPMQPSRKSRHSGRRGWQRRAACDGRSVLLLSHR